MEKQRFLEEKCLLVHALLILTMLAVLFFSKSYPKHFYVFFLLIYLRSELNISFSFLFFFSGGGLFGILGEKQNTKISIKEKQRREPTKNALSNQLPLWEMGLHPTGVLGGSTEYKRGKARKLG